MFIFIIRSESKHSNSRIGADGVMVSSALGEFGPTAMLFRLGNFGE